MSEIKTSNVGGLFIDGAGIPHTLIGYCEQPTATLESLCNRRVSGAIDSLIMAEFESIGNVDKDRLIVLVEDLYEALKCNSAELNNIKLKLADMTVKYADLRMKNLDKPS